MSLGHGKATDSTDGGDSGGGGASNTLTGPRDMRPQLAQQVCARCGLGEQRHRDDGTRGQWCEPCFAAVVALLSRVNASRHREAARLDPLDDGHRDPLTEWLRLPEPTGPCSRGFACLAQSIEVLQRAHHCPCREARKAVEGLAE